MKILLAAISRAWHRYWQLVRDPTPIPDEEKAW